MAPHVDDPTLETREITPLPGTQPSKGERGDRVNIQYDHRWLHHFAAHQSLASRKPENKAQEDHKVVYCPKRKTGLHLEGKADTALQGFPARTTLRFCEQENETHSIMDLALVTERKVGIIPECACQRVNIRNCYLSVITSFGFGISVASGQHTNSL